MSVLAQAIDQQQWELAAHVLVLGLLRALSHLPPDAVVGLIDVVDGGADDS